MSIEEDIRRGDEAMKLLNNPLLISAFEAVEQGIVDAMRRVKVADHQTQHELVQMLQLHGRLKGVIREHVETGKLAQIHKQSLAQRAKRYLHRER